MDRDRPERWLYLLDAMPAPTLVVYRVGDVIFVNRACRLLWSCDTTTVPPELLRLAMRYSDEERWRTATYIEQHLVWVEAFPVPVHLCGGEGCTVMQVSEPFATGPPLSRDDIRFQSLSRVVAAKHGLTNQEGRVAVLVAARQTNVEIAWALRISPHTARHHVQRVLRKLRVSGRRDVLQALTASHRRVG